MRLRFHKEDKNMSDTADRYNQHPLGLENRYDIRNRRHYQIENCNRGGNWEDFRPHYRSLFHSNPHDTPTHSYRHGDLINQQQGSLELHGYNMMYPSYGSYPPPLPQFVATHPVGNVLQQEIVNYNCRPSPVWSRGIGTIMGASAFQHRSSILESSIAGNTDELVMKIAATFPTVSETHIRCLLKKYHNREAVVMSALQVEKYPIATPGPYLTPPLARNMSIPSTCTPFQMTPPLSIRGTPSASIRRNMVTPPVAMYGSIGTPPLGAWGTPPTRGSSPVLRPGSNSSYCSSPAFGDYKQSPKSQSSPKMKLRYLKSVFPKVDETLLLDTLVSENNNVMKTTEKLKTMGYEKKDMGKSTEKKKKDETDVATAVKSIIEKDIEIQKPTPPPRMKSLEEKNRMKARLAGLYEDIPERLIQIAIESVNFDEEKARHLLMLMVNEEKENKPDAPEEKTGNEVTFEKDAKKDSMLKELQKSLNDDDKKITCEKKMKPRKDVPKVSRGTSTTEDKEYKSMHLTKPTGRNRNLRKGPNDQLLLSDYMTWHGPNPELRLGSDKSLAQGPNKILVLEKQNLAKGPKKENCKGPMWGLAKGSIYSHITMILKG